MESLQTTNRTKYQTLPDSPPSAKSNVCMSCVNYPTTRKVLFVSAHVFPALLIIAGMICISNAKEHKVLEPISAALMCAGGAWATALSIYWFAKCSSEVNSPILGNPRVF